jgi:hypothetical protein
MFANSPIRRSDSGGILIGVLIVMVLATGLVGLLYSVTGQSTYISKRNADRAQAIAYGDGVMESLFDQWRFAMISVTDATDRAEGLTNAALATALVAPTATALPPPPNISLASWNVTAATPLLVPVTRSSARPTAEKGTTSTLLTRIHYLATVQVNYSAQGNNNSVTLQRNFVRGGPSLFENFLYCSQPATEFAPGSAMYITGTVYVGGDLYTPRDNLHFQKDVTFTGSHTVNYRSNDPKYGTAPDIFNGGLGDNWDLDNPPHIGRDQKLLEVQFTSLDPNFMDDPISNDTDSNSNPNDDGYREIIQEATSGFADPLQLDATRSERLVKNADYRIYVNSTNTVSIYKGTSATALATSNTEYIAIKAAITTNTALQDDRTGDNVRTVTLNVDSVRTSYAASTITDNNNNSDGLTFYIMDTSFGTSVSTKVGATTVTSSKSRAVRLTNGAKLPYNATNGTGFTVISPNPVYIQGDYNTGTTGTTKPASNTATSYTPPVDNPSPVVPGYTRAPAAVVCDAVNVLSNAWTDANSTLPGPNNWGPTASNTTINCALLGGTVPTTSTSMSGGIENFARLNEDWVGLYFTVYGAMLPLFNSAEAKGAWNMAKYHQPARRFYFDPILREMNPPGFRTTRTYERGVRVIR